MDQEKALPEAPNTTPLLHKRNTQKVEEEQEGPTNFLNCLADNLKMSWIYTMLAGVLLHQQSMYQKHQKKSGFTESSQRIKKSQIPQQGQSYIKLDKESFDEVVLYKLDDQLIKTKIKRIYSQLTYLKFQVIDMQMTVIAPKVFDELRVQDPMGQVLFEESLNLIQNIDKVKNASVAAADGGKGGEFFFFTYDNRVIMKTLSKQDYQTMKIILSYFFNFNNNLLEDYYKHFSANPDSLIARILGLYIFQRKGSHTKTIVILMKHLLAGFPSKYVLRSFDLKGSSSFEYSFIIYLIAFSRQILKDYIQCPTVIKSTLKDIDFLNLEQELNIADSKRKALLSIIQADSEFFSLHSIMDYSLIVFKLNKDKFLVDLVSDNHWKKQNIHVPVELFENTKQFYAIIESNNEPGVYYHLGIIDYLQRYNLQKALEKLSKKVIKLNPQLDTSSQSPKVYSNRFVNFMKSIVLGKENNRNPQNHKT